MKKIEILKLVSDKSDWELYELKDERILRLDKNGSGKEIYDNVDSAFNELGAYYREEVYMMLDECEELSMEVIDLHKAFLSNGEINEMINACSAIAGAYICNANQDGFNKMKLVENRYKQKQRLL